MDVEQKLSTGKELDRDELHQRLIERLGEPRGTALLEDFLRERKERGIDPDNLIDLLKAPLFRYAFCKKWLNGISQHSQEPIEEIFGLVVLETLRDIPSVFYLDNCSVISISTDGFSAKMVNPVSGNHSRLDSEISLINQRCLALSDFLKQERVIFNEIW